MIITRDNERLYLKNWNYNAARIMTALAAVVENNGGKVKPTHSAVISNRTLEHAETELASRIQQMEAIQENAHAEKRAAYIQGQRAELEKIKSIKNEPITVTHTTYICFVLDGFYYYYQVDDNPFFDFYYIKTPVKNKSYSRDAAMETDKKEWLYDCFFSFNVSDADIKEAANLIFNMLMGAKNSVIVRDKTKQRVSNLYDGGYHYETIYAPERFEKIGEWAE